MAEEAIHLTGFFHSGPEPAAHQMRNDSVPYRSTISLQNGICRTNCVDCLDRTNVVQSAFARYVLNRQLLALALFNPESRRSDIDVVFNDVWANNGDAISRA